MLFVEWQNNPLLFHIQPQSKEYQDSNTRFLLDKYLPHPMKRTFFCQPKAETLECFLFIPWTHPDGLPEKIGFPPQMFLPFSTRKANNHS